MDALAETVCPACGARMDAPFCAACGEKRFDHHSLSLAHFFEHAFEAFAHFDGAMFRTLRTLVARPGRLTADYVRGCRKPYLAPVQLFLLMNVLYFAATAVNGWNTLNTDLRTHVTGTWHASVAKSMVLKKLASTGMAEAEYVKAFDAKSGTKAKSLVILMVPVFALLLAAVRFRQKRYFVEHLVFSVHFYAFFLLLFAISTSVTTLVVAGLSGVGVRPGDAALDQVTSSITLAIWWVYLSVAMAETGTRGRARAAAQGLALTIGAVGVLYLYRFLLFLVGYFTTA
jgi:hypothetical protein